MTGATYCEVKVLHRLLMNELYVAQGAPQASQQEAILKARRRGVVSRGVWSFEE